MSPVARVRRRSEAGLALVTVVVVLVGLLVIATPFALSMRHLESGALLEREQESARAGALVAVAAAKRHLEDSHPFFDLDTPHRDTLTELHPADLEQRFAGQLGRNPRGALRSVRIADERGKVHLGTASPWLLGNLLGGRTRLTEELSATDGVVAVGDTAGFPDAGLLWIGPEAVEYSARAEDAFDECRRGFASDNLITSLARGHAAGTEVLDFRLLLLAEYGWRLRPGVFEVFRRVDGLKEIGLFGEMSYTAAELARVEPLLTVHGDGPVWRREQPVLGVFPTATAAPELLLADARGYGPGTIVELTDGEGEREWSLVTRVSPWDGGQRVRLLEPLLLRHGAGSRVRALRREPVNVNTCSLVVLVALLEGLGTAPVADVVTPSEAAWLAGALADAAARGIGSELSMLLRELRPALEEGRFSRDDLAAALTHVETERLDPARSEPAELAGALVGLETPRPVSRVSRAAAETLALRIRAVEPGSHEDLRAVLDAAVAAGDIGADDRELVLRNALDPGDPALTAGTAPFCYASHDVYTLEAAASENLPSGRERARAHVRQIVSVAPPGDAARVFETQRDLERAAAASDGLVGWTTGPHLLRSGPGPAAVPEVEGSELSGVVFDTDSLEEDAREADERLLDWADALAAGRTPPGRIEPLLAGRPGGADTAAGSVLRPEPVRSSLPDTVHFDEGVPGLQGDAPDGLDLARAPVLLPVAGLRPALVDSQGLLSPFGVEFWFVLDDPQAETILFDGGVGELEDRVLLAMSGGELVARVHDTSIPDFEASMPEGQVPPTGEIRYAFDDGLPLQAGVPYHVALRVGGSRGTSMSLWVDGVPRGRRSFTTRLTEPLGDTSGGMLLGTSTTEILVESTAGFPRQGVLRIGRELVEYIDVDERHFVVGSEGGEFDSFGGRAKRESLGADHAAGELVELFGYAMPVLSEKLAQGEADLASDLSRFGVAQLDGDALSHSIEINLDFGATQEPVIIGTGLSSTATTIPVRATGSAPLDGGTFSASGGYALILGDYTGYNQMGYDDIDSSATGGVLDVSTAGAYIGGIEVVHYTSYSGNALQGCSRGVAGIPASVGPIPSPLEEGSISSLGRRGSFQDAKEFVGEFDAQVTGNGQIAVPDQPVNLVVPLSVPLASGDNWDDWHPFPEESDPEEATPAFVQVGLDFDGESDVTEWVRWNTATTDAHVRDDLDAVDDVVSLYQNTGVWNPDAASVDDDWVEACNDELDFRGQLGTPDNDHASGAPLRPVHVLGGFGTDPYDVSLAGAPGRNDAVTLVSEVGEKEWHRVNHAAREGEWHFALRDPVLGEYLRSDSEDLGRYRADDLPLDELLPPESPYRDSISQLQRDSRLYTRVVKAPSGELPSVTPAVFALGRDHSGRRSTGTARVDELRFSVPTAPGPLLPVTARYLLAEEFPDDERAGLRLELEQLVLADGALADPLLGPDALGALAGLPQGGGLLLVGEEIVSYAGMDPDTNGTLFLAERGLFGTPVGSHAPREPVTPLLHWPAAPLAASIDAESARLPLVDASAFPDAPGLLWVGEELIGYTGVEDDALVMPHRRGGSFLSQVGLLRGRHGTRAVEHPAGTLVRWMPERHRDQALLGEEGGLSRAASLGVSAPGAFFTELALEVRLPDPSVGLDARVVLDRAVSPHDEPGGTDGPRDLVALGSAPDAVGDLRVSGVVGRQADRLDLHLFARWVPGAFDPVTFAAQGWKLAPEVRRVVIAHDQPTLVLEHEEWR